MKRVLAIAVLMATACSGSKATEDPSVAEDAPATEPAAAMSSKCHGNQVPPTNYVQETAFVGADTPNATSVASQTAMKNLQDRICQGYRCGELAPHVKVWHTEVDAGVACAMAVIKGDAIRDFQDGPRKRLDADLQDRAQKLIQAAGSSGEPRLAIDAVTDMGVDGGPRAEWMVDRMTAALSEHGAFIANVPVDWSGLKLPKGVDGVLRANITPMHGRESMLEVTWKIQLSRGTKASNAISFPELIGPAVDPTTFQTDHWGRSDLVSLRFDARPGGGLCEGQVTKMQLETAEPLHVRVVNVWGDGSLGTVAWASNGVVAANKVVDLGEFKVAPAVDVPVERFIIVGAKNEAALGMTRGASSQCRLTPADATSISSGAFRNSDAVVTTRSYRVLSGQQCAEFRADPIPADWLQQLPVCP